MRRLYGPVLPALAARFGLLPWELGDLTIAELRSFTAALEKR